jgi:hypothetical protein
MTTVAQRVVVATAAGRANRCIASVIAAAVNTMMPAPARY